MSKLKSYLGLCVKSGGFVLGQDQIKKTKKRPYILVLSPNSSDNLKDLTLRLADKFDCDCILTYELLEDLLSKSGCKLIAITNLSLASAILQQTSEFTQLRSRNGK